MKLPPTSKSFEAKISTLGIIYFMVGLLFAFSFAFYYNWPVTGYFSPGFLMVVFTWPYQAIGFTNHLLIYGLDGPPGVRSF